MIILSIQTMPTNKFIHFLLVILLGWTGLALADGDKPFPPFRIAGNLYYVGSKDLASYLIVTPRGNILINSDYHATVPLLEASIAKLGFKLSDIKILLINHAHADHAGGSALMKEKTGAKYMVMAQDVAVIESGGKKDFQYGSKPNNYYQAVKVDKVLHDGDELKLGNTVLTAHLTPGHTKGCTTWTLKVTEKGKSYNVVIVGGPYVNPGYKLVGNTAYPAISQDYAHTFQVLKSLRCDIFLGAHGMYFRLESKYALLSKSKTNPFVDPAGYNKFIVLTKQEFLNEFAQQKNR
jgi:metallo-beta-lactamase class B